MTKVVSGPALAVSTCVLASKSMRNIKLLVDSDRRRRRKKASFMSLLKTMGRLC